MKGSEMPEYYGYVYQTYNNLNNKFYIGQHAKPEFDKNYYGSGIRIVRAVKKYGKENFTVSVVCWCKDHDALNRMEEFVVGAYLGNEKCYNIGSGGGSPFKGRRRTQAEIENIRKHLTGRPVTQEHRDKQSKTMKMLYQNNPEMSEKIRTRMIGKKHTSESKKNMSVGQTGKKKTYKTGLSHSCKPVKCVETGSIYKALTIAAREMKISKCAISNVLTGRSKKAHGYHFEYVKE